MDVALALIEIEALKSELDATCDALLSAAQSGFELASDTPVDGELVIGMFAEILALCAFQDLAGQRLDRLSRQIGGDRCEARPAGLRRGSTNGALEAGLTP